MGWLELIPMLKRLLPLLSRTVPMLETVLAFRATSSRETDAALEKINAELKSEFAKTAHTNDLVKQTLADHTALLHVLTDDVRQLHQGSAEQDARMEAIEAQIASLSRWLRSFALVTILFLVLCATLLMAIFLRH